MKNGLKFATFLSVSILTCFSQVISNCTAPFFYLGTKCVFINPFSEGLWMEGQYFCELYAGDLIMLDDPAMFEALLDYMKEKGLIYHTYWVGGTDEDHEGNWTWINNNVVDDTLLWAMEYSNNNYNSEPLGGTSENCLAMDKNRLLYVDDQDCLKKNSFICEIDPWKRDKMFH